MSARNELEAAILTLLEEFGIAGRLARSLTKEIMRLIDQYDGN